MNLKFALKNIEAFFDVFYDLVLDIKKGVTICNSLLSRDTRIRTWDPLLPKQVR